YVHNILPDIRTFCPCCRFFANSNPMTSGQCHKQDCPLDHGIDKAYEQPGNRPPPRSSSTPRGNSDTGAMSRMEQRRKELYGPSGQPRSEGGSSIRKVREARVPAATKQMASERQQSASAVSRSTDKATETVEPPIDTQQNCPSPKPLIPTPKNPTIEGTNNNEEVQILDGGQHHTVP